MDREAWLEDAMAQWEVPLLRTCYLLLKDASLAEDAVQECFIKAWKSRGSFRGEASDKTWLMRIAVNVCRDMRRGWWLRHVDRSVRLEDLPEPSVPFTVQDDTLTRAVLALPDKLRQMVILRYYQGLSIQETADAAGVSVRTVHDRLNKAQRALTHAMKEEEPC